MRILVFEDGSIPSKALDDRLNQFRAFMPQVGQYLRFVNANENPDDVAVYGIKVFPTLIMIDKSGACIWKFEGYRPNYDIEDAIAKQVKHEKDADQFPQYNRGYAKYAH